MSFQQKATFGEAPTAVKKIEEEKDNGEDNDVKVTDRAEAGDGGMDLWEAEGDVVGEVVVDGDDVVDLFVGDVDG
ncbi:hypothetical protein MRB53_014052 [Persea americana]|uniref:Uncharacterized protein n=1 Tax=Persea americana TaxID=3435 RepID=A0ACC2K9V2_PERAE|nr:hypothetical protein MRB53_014052 [Persea americana]